MIRYRFLPLVLLAAMVALGLILEAALYGGPRWLVKLPLVLLLVWMVLRVRGRRRRSCTSSSS